ncbi:hypothetical protein N7448_011391 [Penicillium atrosanguineum]|nr:hypothetical protein N7448_011391 [Penicillium atrosanguineum]
MPTRSPVYMTITVWRRKKRAVVRMGAQPAHAGYGRQDVAFMETVVETHGGWTFLGPSSWRYLVLQMGIPGQRKRHQSVIQSTHWEWRLWVSAGSRGTVQAEGYDN